LESQTFINELWLKHSIKQNLTNQYLQTWLSSLNDSPKAMNYLNILNDKDNLTLSKFRTTNHKLPERIEYVPYGIMEITQYMFYIFQPHTVSISHSQHIIHTFINEKQIALFAFH
jgi:hypothetical protein